MLLPTPSLNRRRLRGIHRVCCGWTNETDRFKASLLVFFALTLFPGFPVAQADSLWSTQVQSPYSQPVRRFQNGDPVTIYIKETLQAAQEGKTSASKQSEVNGSLVDWFQQFATNLAGDEQIRRDREFTVGGGDDYKGEGKTSRRSEIKGVVAA